ncbi:MAG TPA: hypothetical protein VF921_17970 [Vicinamibacterales bacterium]
MRKVGGFTVAALVALAFGSLPSAQGGQSVPINVQPASAVDVVLFSAANAGKVVASTGSDGKGTLDILKLANLGKIAVVEEKCPDRTRVLLVASDGREPDSKDCRKKRVGVFWVGRDTALNVTLSGAPTATTAGRGGMSKTTKEILIGAGAAAAVTGVVVAKGGGGTSSPTTPTTPTIDLTPRFGTFNINATKTTDTGCNFNGSFSGQFYVGGIADGSNLTLRMIERLTRAYAGSMQSSGSYSGTGSGNLDGFAYTGTVSGTATNTTVSGIETLNFSTGCPGKMVVYAFSGTK